VPHDLEAPCGDDADWSLLYRARGDEVVPHRPIFTGDVFEKVVVQYPDGLTKHKNVIIVQHPCAMRSNGVDLVLRLLVAEVRNHRVISPGEWTGYGKNMPLPDLVPTVETGRRNQAGFFDELHLVGPQALQDRIACLSQLGVNLLLQRWIHHNSRVVVPTFTLNEVTSGVFEEADLIEEWCEDRTTSGDTVEQATKECVAWLREDGGGGLMRQRMLEDPQNRSGIRKQMRIALRALRG
jgi:hypothetical protein